MATSSLGPLRSFPFLRIVARTSADLKGCYFAFPELLAMKTKSDQSRATAQKRADFLGRGALEIKALYWLELQARPQKADEAARMFIPRHRL